MHEGRTAAPRHRMRVSSESPPRLHALARASGRASGSARAGCADAVTESSQPALTGQSDCVAETVPASSTCEASGVVARISQSLTLPLRVRLCQKPSPGPRRRPHPSWRLPSWRLGRRQRLPCGEAPSARRVLARLAPPRWRRTRDGLPGASGGCTRAPFSAAPHARRLARGALVLVGGPPAGGLSSPTPPLAVLEVAVAAAAAVVTVTAVTAASPRGHCVRCRPDERETIERQQHSWGSCRHRRSAPGPWPTGRLSESDRAGWSTAEPAWASSPCSGAVARREPLRGRSCQYWPVGACALASSTRTVAQTLPLERVCSITASNITHTGQWGSRRAGARERVRSVAAWCASRVGPRRINRLVGAPVQQEQYQVVQHEPSEREVLVLDEVAAAGVERHHV